MLELYRKQKQREKLLIKKLFLVFANRTIREELDNTKWYPILKIVTDRLDSNKFNYNTLQIKINLKGIEYFVKNGYNDMYYKGRKVLTSKYILHNRHNEIRFAIYHELKHFCDRIKYGKNPHLTFGKRGAEYRADSYALSKLKHSRRANWNI